MMKQPVCVWCGLKLPGVVPDSASEITCFECDQKDPVDRFVEWLDNETQSPFYDERDIRGRLRQVIREKGGTP